MTSTLEERVEDYLDGYLSTREARAFEGELLDPAVARVLNEALALRSLLASLPPDGPPDGLVARIEAAMGVAEGRRSRRAGKQARPRFPRFAAALAGAGWALRGPAQVVNAAGADGLRTVGYATGPLTLSRAPREPRPALWLRLLGFGG